MQNVEVSIEEAVNSVVQKGKEITVEVEENDFFFIESIIGAYVQVEGETIIIGKVDEESMFELRVNMTGISCIEKKEESLEVTLFLKENKKIKIMQNKC